MSSDTIRPSRWWYALSTAIVVVGTVVYIVLFIILFLSLKGGIRQVIVPGVHKLQLCQSGRYVIHHEYQSVVENKTSLTNEDVIADLVCSIRSEDVTEEIVVGPTSPNERYEFNGKRKGVSVFELRIARPGTYVLTAEYSNGRKEPKVVLGVARELLARVLVPWILLTVYTVAIIGISGGIFWITFFKRRKAEKKLLQINAQGQE